jgi:uncharacterized protein (TIGR03790 family)
LKAIALSLLLGYFGGIAAAQNFAPSPQVSPTLSLRTDAREADRYANATLVVFNETDPVSVDLANFYAAQRHIPADHLLGLQCTTEETVSRVDYDRTIAEPVRATMTLRGFWTLHENADGTRRVAQNRIRFIALIRGVPLRINGDNNYQGDERNGGGPMIEHNEAAVDSELAGVGYFSRRISSAQTNFYYRSFTPILEGSIPPMMLVCRLDAPTAEVVKRMITDSIATERAGLWGFAAIDSRNIKSGPLSEGDVWLDRVAADMRTHGIPTIVDNGPEMFSANYPLRDVAFYYGWYSGDVAGPFAKETFKFKRGAVACHIHSFSATTLRDPVKGWAGPLLMRGAAATIGNVFEPYLSLTTNLDILHERLRNGFTFAESAYMGTRALSWMNTFVGDPLYRPFKYAQDLLAEPPKAAGEWGVYRAGALLWAKDQGTGSKRLLQSARQMRSGIIAEGLGLLQATTTDTSGALSSFALARQFYTQSDDVLRVSIHEVSLLRALDRKDDALALARRQIKVFETAPAADVLRDIVNQLAPPPPTPANPPR